MKRIIRCLLSLVLLCLLLPSLSAFAEQSADARGIEKLKVVYSEEEAMKPEVSSEEVLPPGKKSVPGSISFVPSAAGLIIAGTVVKDLINR